MSRDTDEFHDHLEKCAHCRDNPLDLCRVGVELLEALAAESLAVPLPEERERFISLIDDQELAQLEARPWYRWYVRDTYRLRYVPLEHQRLFRIAGKLEIPQWLVEDAAAVIGMARGVDRLEAYDRLACALEHLEGGGPEYLRIRRTREEGSWQIW